MEGLWDLLGGRLSPAGRIWGAALPALLILAYLGVGGVVFFVRNHLRGAFRDDELAGRGSSVLLGMGIRQYFSWVTRPCYRALLAVGLPATALTTLSVLLASASAVAIGAGRFSLGGWLYVLGGICDFFDGRLARAAGEAGPRGAALDSVLDRYSDGVVLLGLGWYYRGSWVLLAVGALMIASFMVSYVRARGEGLGVEVKVGLMQRPERIAYLGTAVALSPIPEAIYAPTNPHPAHYLAVLTILLLAVSTTATAGHRLAYLLRTLGGAERPNPWTSAEPGALMRFVISSAVATVADFALVLALVLHAGLRPWFATFVGCGLGAVINFALHRWWASGGERSARRQLSRYAFASASSAGLNAGGVAVLMLSPLDYRIGWLVARGAVALLWNFPLNREYVFAVAVGAGAAARRRRPAASQAAGRALARRGGAALHGAGSVRLKLDPK